MYSLWPSIYYQCLGPKSVKFLTSSRPRQCEIQVDLFMPDHLFRFGKHTEVFDELQEYTFITKFRGLPGLSQPVHISVDTKKGADEFDWVSLVKWAIIPPLQYQYAFNHVKITGYVSCQFRKVHLHFQCSIEKFDIFYPCPKCEKFLNRYPVELGQLSFNHINTIENYQTFVDFPVIIKMHDGNWLERTLFFDPHL